MAEESEQAPKASGTFHIGETVNFVPSKEDLREDDDAVDEYLMKGLGPAAPPLTPESSIVTVGPCFASSVGQHLAKQGYTLANRRNRNAYVSRFGEKIGNTFAIRGQLEWAWLGKTPETELWHGYEAEILPYEAGAQFRTRRLFDVADVLIITLGNPEIWEDAKTGGVFWGAVPEAQFDPTRHRFRVSTYQENLVNLMESYRLIRSKRPEMTIVVSLSVPAAPATFRPVAGIAAGAAGKAILRSALDEFWRVVQPRDAKFHYFPSYDIAWHAFDYPLTADARRVQPHVADFNALLFENLFGAPRLGREELLQAFRKALQADARIGGGGPPRPRNA